MNPTHFYMAARLPAGLKTQTAVGLASLASSCQPGGKERRRETGFEKREQLQPAVERSGRNAAARDNSSESPPLLFRCVPSGRLASSRGTLASGLTVARSNDRLVDGYEEQRNPGFSLPKEGRIGARS